METSGFQLRGFLLPNLESQETKQLTVGRVVPLTDGEVQSVLSLNNPFGLQSLDKYAK